MKFNEYIWKLYKESDAGNASIAFFERADISELANKYDFEYPLVAGEYFVSVYHLKTAEIDIYSSVKDYLLDYKVNSIDDARELFRNCIFTDFVPLKFYNIEDESFDYPLIEAENDKLQLDYFLEHFQIISVSLYKTHTEYFIPYFLNRYEFHNFIRLCEYFEIPIPPIPSRRNYNERIWYYFELCSVLSEYRKIINLSPAEFCAFIYDFGPQFLPAPEKSELPNPTKARFIGGGTWDFDFLDNANDKSAESWGAGNTQIRYGDIILMYCTAPRSYIHSIWRATSDSYVNPFTFYYYVVNVGFPVKINPIYYKDFRNNEIIKENPTLKVSMQGLNGKALSQIEYNEFLNLISQSGTDISTLPKLDEYEIETDGILDERDVEFKLIEPLLTRLGIKPKEWIRQLPIRMGRGIRYYPDYALFYKDKRGEESAKIIIEAKYLIANDKQLEEAYLQAKSYAVRLGSSCFILADIQGVYIFELKNKNFNLTEYTKFTWRDLTSPDAFNKLKIILGNCK